MANRVHKGRLEQLVEQALEAEKKGSGVVVPAMELFQLVEELRHLRKKNSRAREKLREIRGKLADVLAEKVLTTQVDERAENWARVPGNEQSWGHTMKPPDTPFMEPK